LVLDREPEKKDEEHESSCDYGYLATRHVAATWAASRRRDRAAWD
jgi:hypothetical protein